MKTALLCAVFLLIGAFFGYKFDRQHTIQIPTGKAYLKIPSGCKARQWMNGIETDCPDGARMYYTEKLKQASPQ